MSIENKLEDVKKEIKKTEEKLSDLQYEQEMLEEELENTEKLNKLTLVASRVIPIWYRKESAKSCLSAIQEKFDSSVLNEFAQEITDLLFNEIEELESELNRLRKETS